MCTVQMNVDVYVRTLNGETFVSQLSPVHSPLYYLPETGIAWFVMLLLSIEVNIPYPVLQQLLRLETCMLSTHLFLSGTGFVQTGYAWTGHMSCY